MCLITGNNVCDNIMFPGRQAVSRKIKHQNDCAGETGLL
jgi:hypothetical protein